MRPAFILLVIAMILAGGNSTFASEPVKPPTEVKPVSPDVKPEGARLTKVEALRIAREELARLKVKVEQLREPTAVYRPKDKRRHVSFMGKVPKPGNHCSVSIDDATGKARFAGGM